MPTKNFRRKTIPVKIGNTVVGGESPVLIQSMTVTNQRDVDASVKETLALAEVGCELVRITAPTVKDAEALQEIVAQVRAAGCKIPISADIHFQPRAAFEALKWVEKVRINPGNFCDTGIMTLKEISQEEFLAGRQRVFDEFGPFVREAKEKGVALRIGVNHGSLSARMLYQYGDTVEGMVESALEYLDVCQAEDFDQIVFSMKSSSPRVAIEAYRLLEQRLRTENHKAYPFHLGVTEAGEGEDGRLKSAVGIGALLIDGIGATIRVSLTEAPVEEIPVAQKLVAECNEIQKINHQSGIRAPLGTGTADTVHYHRRSSAVFDLNGVELGGNNPIRVGHSEAEQSTMRVTNVARPLEIVGGHGWEHINAQEALLAGAENLAPISNLEIELQKPADLQRLDELLQLRKEPTIWSYTGAALLVGTRTLAEALNRAKREDAIMLRASENKDENHSTALAAIWGNLLSDGIGDGILVNDLDLGYDILQAVGLRRTKTEFISCPGCGRTLFDIQQVLATIKERLGHLRGVSIAVMGCIVNGPGEMADADFGYVGGAPGKISLYENKNLVKRNIPQDEALDQLVELIKSRGRWIDKV